MMLLVVANRLPGKVAFIPCSMAYQRIIILLQSVGLSNRTVGLVSTDHILGPQNCFYNLQQDWQTGWQLHVQLSSFMFNAKIDTTCVKACLPDLP